MKLHQTVTILLNLLATGAGFGIHNFQIRRASLDTSTLLAANSQNESDNDFDEIPPSFPAGGPFFPAGDNMASRPSKADVYGEEELSFLLNLHKQISPQTLKQKKTEDPVLDDSLHDMVMNTLAEIDLGGSVYNGPPPSESKGPSLPSEIKSKIGDIKAIISDIDGTIITSDQKIHPRTMQGIRNAISSAASPTGKLDYFFPATGKTRAGAFNSLGPELAESLSKSPGVFIQGLYCVNEGKVVFEKKLSQAAVKGAEELVKEFDCAIVAYDGDNLYTSKLTQYTIDLLKYYGEPAAKELDVLADHPSIHKVLLMDDDIEKLKRLRPRLEELGKVTESCVTQAVPSMLELIPEGCSKALGVLKLCELLGINPSTDVLAIGDAENDVGMLNMAAIGVAVGNGSALAKEAADVVLQETNDEGGAGVAIEIILGEAPEE